MATRGDVIARRSQQIRTDKGWSLRELSRRLDGVGHRLDASSILKLERGERRITVDDWFALAEALEVPPSDLIVRDGEKSDYATELRGVAELSYRLSRTARSLQESLTDKKGSGGANGT